MGTLAPRMRRTDLRVARGGRHQQQHPLAERFEAVGEALSRGGDGVVACAVVGRRLAREGADLGEALEGLRLTTARTTGREPSYAAVRALGTAWSEEMLTFLHRLSCEDPLTGLAGPAHLRARLAEVYRGAEQHGETVSRSHALVVLDMPRTRTTDRLGSALTTARVTEQVRLVFPGEETLCRVHRSRLLVLTRRVPDLARRVADLRVLVGAAGPGGVGPEVGPVRAWIEGLPGTVTGAVMLLDELSRRPGGD